jgi:hypothetical protein
MYPWNWNPLYSILMVVLVIVLILWLLGRL